MKTKWSSKKLSLNSKRKVLKLALCLLTLRITFLNASSAYILWKKSTFGFQSEKTQSYVATYFSEIIQNPKTDTSFCKEIFFVKIFRYKNKSSFFVMNFFRLVLDNFSSQLIMLQQLCFTKKNLTKIKSLTKIQNSDEKMFSHFSDSFKL